MYKYTLSVCHPARSLRIKSLLTKAIGTGCALVLAPFAQAFDLNEMLTTNSTPYSGTQSVAIGEKEKPLFTAKTYHEGDSVRMDIADGPQGMSVVMNLIQGDSTMLLHEASMYKTMSGKSLKKFQGTMKMEYSNQQEVGSETVNGVSTTKYTADHVDPQGKSGTGTYWVTDGGILVRSEVEVKRRRKVERTVTNLTDIEQGDQPDELFEIPASYQAISLGALFSGGNRQNTSESGPVSDQERAQDESYSDQSYDEQSYDEQSEPAPEPETRGKRARKALGRLLRGGNG